MGLPIVGARAVELRDEHPESTIFNAKRFIGRTLGNVAEDARQHPFRVAADEANATVQAMGLDKSPAGFTVPAGRKTKWVSPVQVGAEVVKQLKRSVAEHVGYTMSQTVICVPAKFGYEEAKATQEAFELAGFRVTRVLEEPTAAAIAYNLHKGTGVKHVLVYDIGGGTLDTSLLYMNGKAVSVLGVAGDDHLGGSDFDIRMRDFLMKRVASAKKVEPSPDLVAKHNCQKSGLLILGEETKISLSSEAAVQVMCKEEDGSIRELVVTRQEFEEASDDLFQRSMAPVQKVLDHQMMTADDVNDVVLVGGASRMPKLRQLLKEFMGEEKDLHTEIDPDVTVAWGAANVI